MPVKRTPRGSFSEPAPVAWSPERTARGTSPRPRSPRCTEPGCPVRFRDGSGPDRFCRDHARADEAGDADERSLALAYAAPPRNRNWPRVRSLTPGEKADLDGEALSVPDSPQDRGHPVAPGRRREGRGGDRGPSGHDEAPASGMDGGPGPA